MGRSIVLLCSCVIVSPSLVLLLSLLASLLQTKTNWPAKIWPLLGKKRKNLRWKQAIWQWASTEKYLFVSAGTKCACLLCGESISATKEYNLRKHFRTMHTNFDTAENWLKTQSQTSCNYCCHFIVRTFIMCFISTVNIIGGMCFCWAECILCTQRIFIFTITGLTAHQEGSITSLKALIVC